MEQRNCVLCESGGLQFLPYFYEYMGRRYRIVRCRECGLGTLQPMPDAETVRALYTQEYFDDDYRCGMAGAPYREWIEGIQRESASYLSMIERFSPPGGTFLEIGCAGGAVLDCARSRGYRPVGVELSPAMASWGRQRFGLDIRVGTLEEQDFEHGSFDVVFLGDVVEHLLQPRQVVARVADVLRPGGVIAIAFPMELNNLGARARIALRRDRRSPQKPYHLWYFTVNSLENLLAQSGFTVVHSETTKIIRKRPVFARALDTVNWIANKITGVWGDRGFIIALSRPDKGQS